MHSIFGISIIMFRNHNEQPSYESVIETAASATLASMSSLNQNQPQTKMAEDRTRLSNQGRVTLSCES